MTIEVVDPHKARVILGEHGISCKISGNAVIVSEGDSQLAETLLEDEKTTSA